MQNDNDILTVRSRDGEYTLFYSKIGKGSTNCLKCDFFVNGVCHAPSVCIATEAGFTGSHWRKNARVAVETNQYKPKYLYNEATFEVANNTGHKCLINKMDSK